MKYSICSKFGVLRSKIENLENSLFKNVRAPSIYSQQRVE